MRKHTATTPSTKDTEKFTFQRYPDKYQVETRQVEREYPNGGALFYRGDTVNRFIYPVAYAEYREGWSETQYDEKFREVITDLSPVTYKTMLIEPVREYEFYYPGPLEYKEILFRQIFVQRILERAKCIQRAFNKTPDEVLIFHNQEGELVYIFGVCSKDYWEEHNDALPEYVAKTAMTAKEFQLHWEQKKAQGQEEFERKRDREEKSFEELLRETSRIDRDFESKESKDSMTMQEKLQIWIAKTQFTDFYHALEARVKGQEELEYIAANIYSYINCMANGQKHNSNFLLAAPSGCGKTETYRAVRDYFAEVLPEFVVSQVDMTSVTEEGYRGKNTDYIVNAFFDGKNTKEYGIVFMDEFDKKLIPSYTNAGINTNAAVQAQILTLIEGRLITQDRTNAGPVDTSKILFVGLGAYDSVRSKKDSRTTHLGFNTSEEEENTHYSFVTRDDMIAVGASYELIGRFSSIVNFHELSEEAVRGIIELMRKREEQRMCCNLVIEEAMVQALLTRANGRFGCRLMDSVIHEKAMRGYMEILRGNGVPQEYTIILLNEDETVVEREADEY